MVFTSYGSENLYTKSIIVSGGGLGNGNAYAVVEIMYYDKEMKTIHSVWYKEFGNNPTCKKIGDEIEWCEDGDFKVLLNGVYIDEEDKED